MAGLTEHNPTERYGARASLYDQYRPRYPAQAFDAILDGLGDPKALDAIDVGAGTGVSTRALERRGVRSVVALEPNKDMREAAGAVGAKSWDATAEHTLLPDESFDLVLCAQSFHWFHKDLALAEFRRLLRPSGRLALLVNMRDAAHIVAREYRALMREFAGDIPEQGRMAYEAPFERSWLFTGARCIRFRYGERVDEESFLGSARSVTYFPREEEPRERLTALLRKLFARYASSDGRILCAYQTVLWLADPAPC